MQEWTGSIQDADMTTSYRIGVVPIKQSLHFKSVYISQMRFQFVPNIFFIQSEAVFCEVSVSVMPSCGVDVHLFETCAGFESMPVC